MNWSRVLEDARYGYLVFKEQNTIPQPEIPGGQTFNIRAFVKNASPISSLQNFSGPEYRPNSLPPKN